MLITSGYPKLPTTAEDLNSWIRGHFSVCQISRAYIELPFQASVGGPGTEPKEYIHRAIAITLGFSGAEEDCCQAIAAHLLCCITRESYEDAAEPLFMRTYFTVEKNELSNGKPYVSGRLAFWDLAKYRKLVASTVYRPQGDLYPPAKMPDMWADTWCNV